MLKVVFSHGKDTTRQSLTLRDNSLSPRTRKMPHIDYYFATISPYTYLAGTRMEPPPSLACAMGTMPAATAAAEPPLLPPTE